MSDLPENYGTPEYEAAWMRKKLNLPADSKTTQLQGAMHVVCHEAHGYDRYIKAYKCDDKQGEIARQSVQISELQAENASLREDLRKYKEALTDTTERAMRAELLVRLTAQEGAVGFDEDGLTYYHFVEGCEWDDETRFPCTYTNGIPDLTPEQWQRLAELERGGG